MKSSETTSKQKEKDIDDYTKRELNKFNPVSGLQAIENREVELKVEIKDIQFPSFKSIIRSEKPTVSLKLRHNETGENMCMELLLDRLSSSEESMNTMTQFLNTLDIERENLGEILGENINVIVKKNGSEYIVRPSEMVNFSIENTNSRDTGLIQEIWRAEDYGRAKIVGIDSHSGQNRATLRMEIPWCGKKHSVTLSTLPKDTYNFNSFFKAITGHPPILRSEIRQLVGSEIEVDYSGRFGIGKSLKSQMENQKYTFRQFVLENGSGIRNKLVKNMIFCSLLSLFPPATVLTVGILSPLFLTSVSLGIVAFTLLMFCLSLLLTGLSTFDSYRKGRGLRG